MAHEIDSLSQSSLAWCTWTRLPRRPDKGAVTGFVSDLAARWPSWPDFGLTKPRGRDKRCKTLSASPQVKPYGCRSHHGVKIPTDQKVVGRMGLLEDADAIAALVLCGPDGIYVRLGAVGSEAYMTAEHEGRDCARVKTQAATRLSRAGFHPVGKWEIDERASDDDDDTWV